MRALGTLSSHAGRAACAALALVLSKASAQDPAPERTLHWETGRVSVQGDIATLELPAGWRYLQQADARYIVEDVWGNPPDGSVLGLVVPPDGPDGEDAGWAIIVEYESDGYVDDADASEIDYDELLGQMQEDAHADNEARRKGGFGTVELLGWAEPPHYDAADKKLYWAKSLQFEGLPEPTLNYNVRILGRRGVLVMNAVAGLGQLDTVAAGAKQILAVTEFTPGNRYDEFDPQIDKIAAYGIGGLIAGKVLLKAGILKVLLKPLLIGLAVVGGLVVKLLGRRKHAPAESGAA